MRVLLALAPGSPVVHAKLDAPLVLHARFHDDFNDHLAALQTRQRSPAEVAAWLERVACHDAFRRAARLPCSAWYAFPLLTLEDWTDPAAGGLRLRRQRHLEVQVRIRVRVNADGHVAWTAGP
ncbi:hypothetical protein [Deinococcus pimensis]|uniref:hypothetical protein n=1 Tax=Deinococcus pimensis TaxID=309888 RepID=UPI0012F760AD|nr:hypothetical protein [Deinococcus pimensis]